LLERLQEDHPLKRAPIRRLLRSLPILNLAHQH
jgi:hypothetical protein